MLIYNGNWKVYIHKNRLNDKMYIGITCQDVNRRWGNGNNYKTCRKFYNAILKHGWNNFLHIIFADNITQLLACNMLKILIWNFDTIDNGYNLNLGGYALLHCKLTKRKISDSIKIFYLTSKEIKKRKIKPKWSLLKRLLAKQRQRINFKKVICLLNNAIYLSIALASRMTGLSRSAIRRSCNSDKTKSIKNHLHFDYYNIQKPNDLLKNVASSDAKWQLPKVG